jgi:hypothetical protein
MNRLLRVLAPICLASLWNTSAFPQQVGSISPPIAHMWVKVENGLLIGFQRARSNDPTAKDVNIFDSQGKAVAGFDILRLVPEAESVAIWDVSVRPADLVAVAATYVKRESGKVMPASVLLYLDFGGDLISAHALTASGEIAALALDDRSNVWTIARGSGLEPDSDGPLIVEYDKLGNVVRKMLPRRLFPPHQRGVQQNPEIGAVAAGYEAGTFWFWLPSSTDLVTVRAKDGVVTSRIRTGYPVQQGHTLWPLLVTREPSGILVAEARVEDTESPLSAPSLAYYAWSPDTGKWSVSHFDACAGYRLIGVDHNEEVFFQFGPKDNICSTSRH